MSVSAPEQPSWILEPRISPGRRIRNGLATVWMVGSVLLAIVPLVFVFGYVLMKGLKIVDWSFLTEDLPIISRQPGGGMYPAIVGTIVITFWATVMAVPLGVLATIYLTEYGGTGRLPGIIRFMADVMTGVPSIVMGLFVYTIWVFDHGLTGFAGSLALGRVDVADHHSLDGRDAAARPGRPPATRATHSVSRRWRTTIRVVLPAALPGIVSGAMLAVARAAGETAPLLFTIGASRKANWNTFQGVNTALPLQIFNNATPAVPCRSRSRMGCCVHVDHDRVHLHDHRSHRVSTFRDQVAVGTRLVSVRPAGCRPSRATARLDP